MIRELNLKNFILIEDMSLQFREGLNVFTGETGAGKSIILEGLRICLGKRTSKELLRNPDEKAVFELILESEEDLITVSREIFPSGKALSRLGGELTSVEIIQETVAPLLDIYGQKDHYSILSPSYQLDMLDHYGAKDVNPLLMSIHDLLEKWRATEAEEARYAELLSLDEGELRRHYDELVELFIDPERDQEIEKTFERLEHARELSELMEDSSSIMEDLLSDNLSQLDRNLESISRVDPLYESYLERLSSLRIELEDIKESVDADLRNLDIDEETLSQMNRRVEELFDVKKRYRMDLVELKAHEKELQQTLERLEEASSGLASIKKRKEDIRAAYMDVSEHLKEKREVVFERFKEELTGVLDGLELKGAKVELSQVPRKGDRFHEGGHFGVELLASLTHQKPKPLSEVLSGGETSRFILAVKQVLSGVDQTKILVFDEIDSGISGKVAFEVGKAIRELAKDKQVIAITHLPQLASFADQHFLIEKNDFKTSVNRLTEEESLQRLAIMMSSSKSETAIEHARELMAKARKEIQ